MSKSELMKNKLNECDMFVELTIPTFISANSSGELKLRKVALTITSILNCKETFKLNMDTYFEDLTEEDYLIVWESKHKKSERIAFANHIKQGNYILNYLDMCNERYSDEEER